MARAIAVLGSASDVGKSVVTAGLCRLFADAGLDVAPFKAQNMGNQAGVTAEELEMPRAQILQAIACRQTPHVDMGPVLMKPVSMTAAEVVVLGRAVGLVEAREYFRDTSKLAAVAFAALDRLAARHATLVLEGAGSPVELNLMDRDFVNLRAARHVNAGLVLVVDIDRGGVFAQAKGTIDLLPDEDRRRLLGVIVNRFRGDPALFDEGIGALERLCGVPVLALIPHVDHGLDEEDRPISLPIDQIGARDQLRVGAILMPHVSNTEDLAPLLAEPDVHVTWLSDPRLVAEVDLVILPGSKATVADLMYLAATGFTAALEEAARRGAWFLGLCGGYQMLGEMVEDRAGSEGGAPLWPGLGLLPLRTVFEQRKQLKQSSFLSVWPEPGQPLIGYEIHHGTTHPLREVEPVVEGAGAEVGGRSGRVVGCYLHGILAADAWRSSFLNLVRSGRGLPSQPRRSADSIDAKIARWARHVRAHLRPGAWERLLASARP
jgi:adenosylcobyric acid synthase